VGLTEGLHLTLQSVVHSMIFPHVFLQVMACRW